MTSTPELTVQLQELHVDDGAVERIRTFDAGSAWRGQRHRRAAAGVLVAVIVCLAVARSTLGVDPRSVRQTSGASTIPAVTLDITKDGALQESVRVGASLLLRAAVPGQPPTTPVSRALLADSRSPHPLTAFRVFYAQVHTARAAKPTTVWVLLQRANTPTPPARPQPLSAATAALQLQRDRDAYRGPVIVKVISGARIIATVTGPLHAV